MDFFCSILSIAGFYYAYLISLLSFCFFRSLILLTFLLVLKFLYFVAFLFLLLNADISRAHFLKKKSPRNSSVTRESACIQKARPICKFFHGTATKYK